LRTYGRFFAEFLNEDSPVHLRLLASPTCVGFRYGHPAFNFRSFSWKLAHSDRPELPPTFSQFLDLCLPDLPGKHPQIKNDNPINHLNY
jgi:hypothetical protein